MSEKMSKAEFIEFKGGISTRFRDLQAGSSEYIAPATVSEVQLEKATLWRKIREIEVAVLQEDI